jgi:simple sugar transport system permease protein
MNAELALVADALVRATPLIIAGLAVAFAFRGGVFNIGAEGQLLVGTVAATAVTLASSGSIGRFSVVLAVVAGALAGAAWAWIAAELKRRFHVLEIISTIMLNFIAIHLVSFLVRGPLQEPARIYPQTETFIKSGRLPILVPGTRLHLGFTLAILLAVTLAWVFNHTAFGFRVRATGASPAAAHIAGLIDTDKTSLAVFLISGALAGIAGSVEVSGVTFALYENLSPGYGYTAIAVALIAGLNPIGIIASGIFFGILETGASALQREFAVPSSLASVLEAALIIGALTIAAVRGRHPIARVAES